MIHIKAKCSDCGLDTEIKFKKRKFGDRLEETYFKCEACHVHTTCFITNAKVRKLQKEVAALRSELYKTELTTSEIERKQVNIDETMNDLLIKHGRR